MKNNIKITKIICISCVCIFAFMAGCEVLTKDTEKARLLEIQNIRYDDSLRHVGEIEELKAQKELMNSLIKNGKKFDREDVERIDYYR